jgi:hypothetical protein
MLKCPNCRTFKRLGHRCTKKDECDCPKCQGMCLCSIMDNGFTSSMVEDNEPNPYMGTYSEE